MAGRLMLVVLVYSFHKIQPQDVPPPKLTVYPSTITETESVTLNCQAPDSVSQCFFNFGRQENVRGSSCLKTLTGNELLSITSQKSPAVVEVMCYYNVKVGEQIYASPYGDTSFITLHSVPPPKLTVYPSMITETDSVSMNCQAPDSVSQCHFNFGRQENVRGSSCLKNLTGNELLSITSQKSPAVVEVMCYYTVKLGEQTYASPYGHISFITIHNGPPLKLMVYPSMITETDSVTMNCQVPDSVSQCYFNFGRQENVRGSSCLKTLTGNELLSITSQKSPAVVEVMCYYTLKLGGQTYAPASYLNIYSDTSSITIHNIVKKESSTAPTPRAFTTGLTVSRLPASTAVITATQTPGFTLSRPAQTNTFISTSLKPVKPASETWMWKVIIGVTGFGVTMAVTLLVVALLSIRRGAERCSHNRSRTQAVDSDDSVWMENLNYGQLLPAGSHEAYSVITSAPPPDCHEGSEKLNRQESHNEDSDTYHVYFTIPENPPPSAQDMVHSPMHAH